MIYLFIHQSFPAQYQHVVEHLLAQGGNTIYFVSQPGEIEIAGVHRLIYKVETPTAPLNCHPLTVNLDAAIRNAASVQDVCRRLRDEQGVYPDLIVGHGGWGETLFVKELFPDAPVLTYFEFYYHASGVDLDFDPEFESLFREPDRLRTRNAVSLMAFDATDWGHAPTQWQRSLMPPEMRRRITVLHEGVDTDRAKPDAAAHFEYPEQQLSLTRDDEVITYVARCLEPYRGFHIFMRALPEILRRRPRARVVIVGGEGVAYGAAPAPGSSYRQLMLAEIGAQIDASRVHFIAKLDYDALLRLFQVSSVHVYLTYPFVLSWSFIDAMSSGCLIIGSATPPVLEVLDDGVNGLTVDFFAPQQLAERVDEALGDPVRMRSLRAAARQTALDHFDLKRVILPRWMTLFDDLVNGRRPALDP